MAGTTAEVCEANRTRDVAKIARERSIASLATSLVYDPETNTLDFPGGPPKEERDADEPWVLRETLVKGLAYSQYRAENDTNFSHHVMILRTSAGWDSEKSIPDTRDDTFE